MNATTKKTDKPYSIRNVPNPFCATLPDDVELKVTGSNVTVENMRCPLTKAGFEQPLTQSLKPQVEGVDVDLDTAINTAVKLLKKTCSPLFSGMATDVNGNRSILQLADKLGGTVDHMHSDSLLRNVKAMSDQGWIMTTLTEIKNRADLVIFIGTDASEHSRFYERIIWLEETLFIDQAEREVVYIGKGLKTKLGISPLGKRPSVVTNDINETAITMNALNAILNDTPLQTKKAGGASIKHLQKLAQKITAAEYPVFIWSPSNLDFSHAELAVGAICNVVRTLSKSQRAAGFSLGGADASSTATAVCTWQTGYPTRVSFAKGYPDYNPSRYSTTEILQNSQADALIWVSTISANKLPPSTKLPCIVIGEPGMQLTTPPTVFIPAGTPGLDHKGLMVRVDSVVSLPLKKVRDIGLPSVDSIFEKIYQKL